MSKVAVAKVAVVDVADTTGNPSVKTDVESGVTLQVPTMVIVCEVEEAMAAVWPGASDTMWTP